MPERSPTIIVGAGVAGLVAALRLAHQGRAVTILESAARPGGRVHSQEVQGALVDSGPTVFTMRWVFDQILAAVGERLEDHLQLQPLSVLARHFWHDGSQLDLFADPERSEAAVADWAGGDEAARFRRFCTRTRAIYDTLQAPVLCAQRPHMASLVRQLGPRGLALLASLGPLRSLWRQMEHEFHDPRLRQLFARYATYCGSSPWQAPATLMLVAQVEMDGVWSVQGGMTAVADMLARLACARGATLRLNSTVRRIDVRQGRACGVELASGETLPASQVLFNGEVGALREGLLGPAARAAVPVRAATRSLSAVTWALHAPVTGVALERHNVFFCPDYRQEFDDIFGQRRLPRLPTVYLCAQDRPRSADGAAPERLFALVNAPAHADTAACSEKELDTCETTAFSAMHRMGLRIPSSSPGMRRSSPADFHRRFPASGGALYGQATHGWTSIFSRPGAHSPVPGLFLAGGGVHPGPGVPMAALSGQRAAEAMLASPASTSRWRPAAISGGMSTP